MDEESAEIFPRKLNTLTYREKFAIIKEIEEGKSLAYISNVYGISKSTLHYMYKDREKIKGICMETPNLSAVRFRSSNIRFPEMEASVLKFIAKAQDRGEKLTGNIIKAIALQTASEMDISPFNASNGWLNSFTKRNGIIFGIKKSGLIDYDPIYDESHLKVEEQEEEEMIQWRNWCRLCSNVDTIADFEPFLYDILQNTFHVNLLENVKIKICRDCHASLIGISKLVERTKISEKMFEELDEQERRNCLTNEGIYSIRQQYEEIALAEGQEAQTRQERLSFSQDTDAIKIEALDYEDEKYTAEIENSYDDDEDDEHDYILESKPSKIRKKVTTMMADEALYDYTCHICHENFERMCFLSNHTRSEHNCLPQVACTCGRLLATWDSLMNHKRKHENTGEWICDLCDSKTFVTKSGLKLHMKFKHLRVKQNHLCTICGKEFKEASGLKQHERSHLPDDEKLIHECEQCGKRFSQKPTLRAHIRLHTSEKTIICHICSKAFTTQNYLKVHLATHEIENIACNYCDGIFKNKSSLQSHVRKMHKPGNTAFPCHECGKLFPNRNFLKRHMASHSGARNYKCTFTGCEQTYKYEKDLRNHYNIHTNVKKKCLYCDREFIDNSNMRKHVLRNHPVEVAEFEAKFGKRRRLKNLLIEHELNSTPIQSQAMQQHLSGGGSFM